MPTNHAADNSWDALRTPRVFVFFVTGVVVIFLTFLTNNNAIEIAISGIASVFIGIGVNNFTSIQGKLEEENLQKQRGQYATKVLDLMQTRTRHASQALQPPDRSALQTDLQEMEQLIGLLRDLLVDNPPVG